MTDFFCSPGRCFSVIGGALVYRDNLGHLTYAYSNSLGPFLAPRVRAIIRASG